MNPRRLYRSHDRQLAGVAGGMAEYLDIDPTVMRILWIVVGIATGGLALIAYVLLALVIPQAPGGYAAAAPGAWSSPPSGPGTWGQAPAAGSAGQGAAWTPPAAPTGWQAPAQPAPSSRTATRGFGAAAVIGVVLVVVGVVALADVALPGWAAGAILGPAVILGLGAALLVASIRRPANEAAAAASGTATGAASAESGPAQATSRGTADAAASGTDQPDADRAAGPPEPPVA